MGTPSSPERLAAFRHDLANPINHVVGYTELLVLSATERKAAGLDLPLQELTRRADDLRRRLEESLPTERIRTSEVDVPAVQSSITASARSLLEQVALLRPQLSGRWAEAEDDLEQIAHAARRVLDLAAAGVRA